MIHRILMMTAGFGELDKLSIYSADAAETAGGAQPADGVAVVALLDQAASARHADQPVGASQPVLDDDAMPGQLAVLFEGTRHLRVDEAPSEVLSFVVSATALSGFRAILARDTAASTTKPSFKLEIGET